MYQRLLLTTLTRDGDPGLLPAELVGLADESLADLAAVLDPCPEPWQGVGYWPVVEAVPVFDPATERLGEPVAVLDAAARRDVRTWPVLPRRAEELVAAFLDRLAERRQQAEVAGMLWRRPGTAETYFIATDRESQAKIHAERTAAEAGERRQGDRWKCGDPATGRAVAIVLSDAEAIALSAAARARVSDCFNREGDLMDLARAALVPGDPAATAAALAEIDIATGWPA